MLSPLLQRFERHNPWQGQTSARRRTRLRASHPVSGIDTSVGHIARFQDDWIRREGKLPEDRDEGGGGCQPTD